MRFKDYITEARLAPLYHGTHIGNATNIIEENKIHSTNDNGHKVNGESGVKGVSLTRSLHFALQWAGDRSIVFELDQLKLSQRFKIVPFNYFNKVARLQKDAAANFGKIERFPHGFKNQMEEFLLGDIFPLDRYLTKIIVRDNETSPIYNLKMIKNISEHPKLYDLKTRRFVNET